MWTRIGQLRSPLQGPVADVWTLTGDDYRMVAPVHCRVGRAFDSDALGNVTFAAFTGDDPLFDLDGDDLSPVA